MAPRNRKDSKSTDKGTKRPVEKTHESLSVAQNLSDVTSYSEAGKRRKHNHHAPSSPNEISSIDLKNEGCNPTYKTGIEDAPRLGPYHPSFALAEAEITRACDVFLHAYNNLKAEGYTNEEIEVVCGDPQFEVSGLSECRIPKSFYPPVKSVAVLGPAGTGKSSALNSLMQTTKAAFAQDGKRGTYVAHEYRFALPHQTSRYIVKVPFFSIKEIEESVHKHFKNIQSYLEPTDDDDDDDDGDDDDDRATTDSYQTAIGFFCDLLADHKEFRTYQDTEYYFKSMESDPDDGVLKDLIQRVSGYVANRTLLQEDEETYNIDSEEDLESFLWDIVRPSNRHNQGRKSCPWPIIRKVVIHQKLGLLKEDVVLADLPGWGDNDEIVAGNTRHYLKQAGVILIFLSFMRPEDKIDEYIRHCLALNKMHQTRLVITMIDQMKDFPERAKAELNTEEQATLRKAEDEVKKLVNEVRETEKAKEQSRNIDPCRFMELDERLKNLDSKLAHAKSRAKEVAIGIRCRHIENDFKDSFRRLRRSTHDPDLPIHFISNTVYQDHMTRSAHDPQPSLSVQATGIPELRREILTYPTRGKLDILHMLSQNRLRSLLGGIDGILTKSILERKTEVHSVLQMHLRNVCIPIVGTVAEIKSMYQKLILGSIAENEKVWKEKAEHVLSVWRRYDSRTLQALLSRGGDWNHRKHGLINFSEQIQRIFDKELAGAYNAFDDRFVGAREDIKRNTQDNFDKIKDAVQHCPAAAGQRMEPFMAYVDQIRRTTVTDIDDQFIELQHEIARIRTSATVDGDDSYVRQAMSPVYDACILINTHNVQNLDRDVKPQSRETKRPRVAKSKKGARGKRRVTAKAPVTAARMQLFRKKLQGECSQELIFQEVGLLGQSDLDWALEDWQSESDKIMTRSRQDILKDFDRRFKAPEIKVEENPEIVSKLKKAAHEATAILDGPMRQRLRECYAYEGKKFPDDC